MTQKNNELLKMIGQRLKDIRKTLGYTQLEFSNHFDCGRANYSRIEASEIRPGAKMLFVLKNKFNVDINYIITGQGEPFLNNANESNDVLKIPPGYQFDEEDLDLFEYYFKSSIVRHSLKAHFRALFFNESNAIKKDIEDLKRTI